MRFNYFIIFLLCFVNTGIQSQVPEYNQRITRTFKAGNGMSVEAVNKYGRVQIIPWDQDSVKFIIDMKLRAKDKAKLEKMKQNVEFEFTPGQYFLIARTSFGESGSDVFKDIVDIAGSYLSSSNSVNINYTILIPPHLSLKVENKFGDVYLDDYSGNFNLVLSYGDLKANRLAGRSEIKVTSGDAEINYIRDGFITISYSDMHIRECGKLTTQTQSSNLTIEKAGTLKINSRRDKLYLNDVNYISGETYFSAVNIGTLHNDITMSSRYGDIIIDNLQRTFSLVNISSELTDITMSFERPMAFGFDLTHHQSVTFTYPSAIARISTKVLNAEDKIFNTSGSLGSANAESRVILKAPRKCNITISQH